MQTYVKKKSWTVACVILYIVWWYFGFWTELIFLTLSSQLYINFILIVQCDKKRHKKVPMMKHIYRFWCDGFASTWWTTVVFECLLI